MAKYDGLLGQPLLEIEEPDKEGGVTLIFKDNRFMFIKVEDGIRDSSVTGVQTCALPICLFHETKTSAPTLCFPFPSSDALKIIGSSNSNNSF